MTDKKYRRFLVACVALAIVWAVMTPTKKSIASSKEENAIKTLEKKMMSSSTKKIVYRKGKIRTTLINRFKNGKNLPLSAKSFSIKKSGYYSFLITTKKGKREIKTFYLKKKKYDIPSNNPIKQKAGCYYVVPKTDSTLAMEVQNSSLLKGGNVSVWVRGDAACRSWKIEQVKGKKFRIKNVNSGQYLTDSRNGVSVGNAVQQPYSATKKEQIFQFYPAGGDYVYIRCVSSKKFLAVKGNNLEFSQRAAKKAWKFKLEPMLYPKSLVRITGGTYPSAIQEGAAFSLMGMVNSRYTMKQIKVCILNSSGQVVIEKSAKPSGCFFDIKQIDAAITFGKLKAGKYIYRIAVMDAAGKELVWVNHSFTVTPKAAVIVPGATPSNRTLSYNNNLIRAIGYQVNGTALEKKACASYALAYCNAILNSSAPSPNTYWLGPDNVNCVWSKGGYDCSPTGYGSEQGVLQAAYMQLVAGKPCILHVTGNTEQHWVCLIGYQGISTIKSLSAANFIAIDPWDGQVITVSSKYKVKNTYRLAIAN